MSESTESKNMDIIDQLVGIQPGSTVAELRARRPDVTLYAQSSYEIVLCCNNPGLRQRSSLRSKATAFSQHFRHARRQSYATLIF